MAATAVILKIHFELFSPELKGQVTRNMIGSIGVTCRSYLNVFRSELKIAVMAVILKINFELLLLIRKQIDLKLGRKYPGDL